MTVQAPSSETDTPGSTPPSAGASTDAVARRRPLGRIASWTIAGVICAAIAAWLVAGLDPSLDRTGVSWQNPAFVEQPQVGASADEEKTWTVWDDDSLAWASVVLHNPRPYPVTVAPDPVGNAVEVTVAEYDPLVQGGVIRPEDVTAVPTLRVPAGGFVVVLIHVSDRCYSMMAGSATGDDSARVNVTSLGLTRSLDIQFPATYMAGTTTGHAADPSCATD